MNDDVNAPDSTGSPGDEGPTHFIPMLPMQQAMSREQLAEIRAAQERLIKLQKAAPFINMGVFAFQQAVALASHGEQPTYHLNIAVHQLRQVIAMLEEFATPRPAQAPSQEPGQ